MNGVLLLIFFLGFASAFWGGLYGISEETISVHPSHQKIYENEDAVIQCRTRENSKVLWTREGGLPLPPQARQNRGRLTINKMLLKEGGWYVCQTEDLKQRKRAFVSVLVRPTRATYSWSWSTQSPFFSTNGIPTTKQLSWTSLFGASTPYPCMYGVCNGTCCGSKSIESFFDCGNGQKINKTLVCNRENDCEDGSDEARCEPWPSKITVLPKHRVEIHCGDEDKSESGTLILECEAVGHPTPLIRWKKYDGHVPSKCQQYSKRGHGILTCPDFQQSDQGAYSCVAENSVKSAESQPKSVAKCRNRINCRGFRVVNEDQIEHCLDCFCSGKTTQCQHLNSNPTVIEIPFPESQTEIFIKTDGEIVFIPTKTNLTPDYKTRESAQGVTYCSLSETDFPDTSFLKSFGRNILIPKHKVKADFAEKAPDLIIRGNGVSLAYTSSPISSIKHDKLDVKAKFWSGNWHHLNKRAATRRDIMKVLSNVDTLFIRCEYQQGKIIEESKQKKVFIESSTISPFSGSVSFVEKCNCPAGYDGISCETCSVGYTKKSQGSDFICEKIVCKEGYTGPNCTDCETTKGYYDNGGSCVKATCHPEGSYSIFPNILGKCQCKEGVTGDACDKCQSDSFYLHKARGCLKCWCSGVTQTCASSTWYRSVISSTPRGGYNSSDGRNFWLLPSEFSGNRLTSYGGHLNYTMKYKPGIPKQSVTLTVEFLSLSDITLIYNHTNVDTSTTYNEKSWSVPLTETHWTKPDRSSVTRGEFLSVLSRIKAVYIESPYHLSSGQANLTSTRMSSASPTGDLDSEVALAVENCSCPAGYTGLSCESCSEGYYRKRKGAITQCIKCNCSNCDPEFGCPDCPELTYRDNPEEEKIPVCKTCPCNGNGISCVKDDHNQIFCRCKPGFTGMHCENKIPKDKNDLTIMISPRRVKGEKMGSTVHFNCTVISSEEMTMTAQKRFSTYSYNNTNILSSSGRRISEVFEVVLEANMEAVECIATDADGKLAGHVVAVVKDTFTQVKPVKITNCYSDKIDVKESETKDIICEATGYPVPMVNWYKKVNEVSIKVDTSDGVHTIESSSTSLKDNGTVYTCIAENSEGDKVTCPKVLIVKKKCEVVSIIPKHVRAKEGDNFTVQCKTTAKNPVTWSQYDTLFKREKFISSFRVHANGSHLHFTNAQPSDSGTYICTVVGESGKINQTISIVIEENRVPPTVYIQEYDQTLKEGESFQANCMATGKPAPTVTWSKLNGTLDSNVYAFGKTLSIEKATLSNAGIYVCEARSSAGNASSDISVEVEQRALPPRLNVSEEVIIAHEGDEANISCLAIGHPRPELSWYGQNVNLTNVSREIDNMILIEPQESVKEVVRFKVTKDMDGAKVSCQASNSAGMEQKSVEVKVLQTKRASNETAKFVQIGSYFELLCNLPGELAWEKIGGMVGDECPIPNGWMIPSVQIQHNGTYVCREKWSDSKKIIHLIVTGFVPKFSRVSRSYLVMPVRLSSAKNVRVEMSFKSEDENGVLLQEENEKLVVYLKNRKIHLSLTSEQNQEPIKMNNHIQLGSWYSLVVSVDRHYVDLTVYRDNAVIHERMTERSKDFLTDVDFDTENFYVGGMPKRRHMGRTFGHHHPHFDGCISRLSIDRQEFDIVKNGSFSQNITLCRRCSDEEDPCSGKGKCLDAPTHYGFVCVCPDEVECPAACAGRLCETRLDLCRLLDPCGGVINTCHNKMYSLQCQCAYGYSGTTCEKAQEYSFCSRGNGYVKLPSSLLEVRHLGVPEIIRMSFTLHKPDGQLLWQGEHANHLSIAVRDGQLEYAYQNQHSKLEVRVAGRVSLDKKHGLMVRRINSSVDLELSRSPGATPEVYRNSTSKVHTNRVFGDVYLGHVPNNTRDGLDGCIHHISFGDKAKVNLQGVEKFNVYQPQMKYRESESENESDEEVEEENEEVEEEKDEVEEESEEEEEEKKGWEEEKSRNSVSNNIGGF